MLRDDQKKYLDEEYAREEFNNNYRGGWKDLAYEKDNTKIPYKTVTQPVYKALFNSDTKNIFGAFFPTTMLSCKILKDDFIPASKFACDCGLNSLNGGMFNIIFEVDGGWIKKLKCSICGLEYGMIEKNFYNLCVDYFYLLVDDSKAEFIRRVNKLEFSDEWKVFQAAGVSPENILNTLSDEDKKLWKEQEEFLNKKQM